MRKSAFAYISYRSVLIDKVRKLSLSAGLNGGISTQSNSYTDEMPQIKLRVNVNSKLAPLPAVEILELLAAVAKAEFRFCLDRCLAVGKLYPRILAFLGNFAP